MLKTSFIVITWKPPAPLPGSDFYCEHQPRQALYDPARQPGSRDTRQTGGNQQGCGLARMDSLPFGGQINLLAASDLWDAEADVISKWESD